MTDQRKLILWYNGDYGDEFDVSGHQIVTKFEYDSIMLYMQNYFKVHKDWSFSFGTNEELIYQSYDEFFRDFKTTLITEEEYAVVGRVGLDSSGTTPIDYLLELSYVEQEEGDDG